jgi:hypothetical protein
VGISGLPVEIGPTAVQNVTVVLTGLHDGAVKEDFLTARFRLARSRNWQVNVSLGFPDLHGAHERNAFGFTLVVFSPAQHVPVRQTQHIDLAR